MENFKKSDFEFVNVGEKIYDKPLQTKPVGFFKDAMIRFSKNKQNIFATSILGFFILLAIFVPVFTKIATQESNPRLRFLPPKIPVIEKLGIFNGLTKVKDVPVDFNEKKSDNLYYPQGYRKEAISKLTNKEVLGAEKKPEFQGGTNVISINQNSVSYSIKTDEITATTDNKKLTVEIKGLENSKILVYFQENITNWDVEELGAIEKPGTYDFNLLKNQSVASYKGSVYLRAVSLDKQKAATAEIVSITYPENGKTSKLEGYPLSILRDVSVDGDRGSYSRKDAKIVLATFTYDPYKALNLDTQQISLTVAEYEAVLKKYPKMDSEKVLVQGKTNEWTFPDKYPLARVKKITSTTIVGESVQFQVLARASYFEKSGSYFVFGSTQEGKGLFSLIWLGLRTSLLVGLIASIINIILGIIYGAISGYYGGRVDLLMQRFSELWGSFPQIAIIGIVSSLMSPGFFSILILLIYDGWLGVSGVTRVQFYRFKGREYILAARTLGAKDKRLIFRHILPNGAGTIITRSILSIPRVIFFETTLSYLGFGIGNGQTLNIFGLKLTGTSLGVLLSDGQSQMLVDGRFYLLLYPTIVLAILMIVFNVFGNALRDAFNPTLRGAE